MSASKAAYLRARYQRLKAAGSCQGCGAEVFPGRTRCTDCGRRNARASKKRSEQQPENQEMKQ